MYGSFLFFINETGQVFTPEALALAWELTQGQPWLINALGYEVCFKMKSKCARFRLDQLRGQVRIANKIYQEVIPRELTLRINYTENGHKFKMRSGKDADKHG